MNENHNNLVYTSSVMSNGAGGWQPCPELLTEDEAILYLRLNTQNKTKPESTLENCRTQGAKENRLHATKIGNNLFFSRKELDKYIELKTN